MTYEDMEHVKHANRKAGHHWFEADTMAFFNTHIETALIGGAYFVTSEQFVASDGTADPRKYTVRFATDSGAIHTLGNFQQFLTLEAARDAAEGLAAGEIRTCDDCNRLEDAGGYPDWPDGVCERCDPSLDLASSIDPESILHAAAGLLTDRGDHNPEYDRALIEMVMEVLAVTRNAAHKMIEDRRVV